MKQIVLDTETTGLDIKKDKIIEIGCVLIDNFIDTRQYFHKYINPGIPVSTQSYNIHNLSDDFLKKQVSFVDIADAFIKFIGNHSLIMHNAQFDLNFINKELEHLNKPLLQNETIDTLAIARKKFPGKSNSLDALCKRFFIDLSSRKNHGALLDAKLLTQVYFCLQDPSTLELEKPKKNNENKVTSKGNELIIKANAQELEEHLTLIKKIQEL